MNSHDTRKKTIGVISDTHGLLRDEVKRQFKNVDHIIHDGDIGKPEVVTELENIAPLTVIRGNVDNGQGLMRKKQPPGHPERTQTDTMVEQVLAWAENASGTFVFNENRPNEGGCQYSRVWNGFGL